MPSNPIMTATGERRQWTNYGKYPMVEAGNILHKTEAPTMMITWIRTGKNVTHKFQQEVARKRSWDGDAPVATEHDKGKTAPGDMDKRGKEKDNKDEGKDSLRKTSLPSPEKPEATCTYRYGGHKHLTQQGRRGISDNLQPCLVSAACSTPERGTSQDYY
ncbi:unnamed protein product [Clonostachys solani]|uniref:Uncharacterized protein n=1 Tax=Clonostachys solani TaxID=160281 RepID=A0A9N9Z7K1_9HYPO|nr:unnamed protein product [Clonostachys solani]